MKKILSLAIVATMILSCTATAFAAPSMVDSPTNGEGQIDNIIFDEFAVSDEETEGLQAYANDEAVAVFSDSPTNNDGVIENIIVVDTDIMPMTSFTDYEVPARTVVLFAGQYLTYANMSVSYKPTNVDLYYGLADSDNGTGGYYANRATGGSGSATVTPRTTSTYYPYLANGTDKAIYADFEYSCVIALRAAQEDGENGIAPLSVLSMSFSNLGKNQFITSAETYYIDSKDAMLTINSLTWNPPSQDLRVGWYDVETGDAVYTLCTGGDVSGRQLNSSKLSTGEYKIYIKNVGSKAVTGALQYEVD